MNVRIAKVDYLRRQRSYLKRRKRYRHKKWYGGGFVAFLIRKRGTVDRCLTWERPRLCMSSRRTPGVSLESVQRAIAAAGWLRDLRRGEYIFSVWRRRL